MFINKPLQNSIVCRVVDKVHYQQDRHCEQIHREAIQMMPIKSTLYGLLR